MSSEPWRPVAGPARVVRGLTAASVCTVLTFTGHVGAGGATPQVGLLVVLGLLLAGFLVALADRRRGPGAILALVGGSQLVLHALLQVLGTSHPHPTTGGPALMTGVHVLATLVTAGLLAGVEAALFTVTSALVRMLPRRLPDRPVPDEAPRRPVRPDAPDRLTPGMPGNRLPDRRGPPRQAH
jgi:hypothetical protein